MASASLTRLPLDPTTGYLPLGRHRTTEADIKARFLDDDQFKASQTRQEAWGDYELGRDLLRSKLRIHAVWFGGSFLTAKVDAKDVDALFIVSASDYRKLDAKGKQVVESFNPAPGPLGALIRGHGLGRLDSYLLMWAPWSPFQPGPQAPDQLQYAGSRGYWDDFWPRDRFHKPNGVPAHWKDALPVRGYLEVMLDAYDR